MAVFNNHLDVYVADSISKISALIAADQDPGQVLRNDSLNTVPECIRDALSDLVSVIKRYRGWNKEKHAEEAHALKELTVEIASLAPLPHVLDRICHQAQHLIASDIGYVALHNPQQHAIVVEASAGTSPALIGVTQKLGQGIGGRAMVTRRPLVFRDYPNEVRRDPDVEQAIDFEGILSGVAAPIISGSAVIGVLYAAMRCYRNFTQDDVDLLMGLASLASVAIQNARLYEAMDRMTSIQEQLSQAAMHDNAIGEIVNRLGALIGSPVMFYDGLGTLTTNAVSAHDDWSKIERAALITKASSPRSIISTEIEVSGHPMPAVLLPIRQDQRTMGVLVISGRLVDQYDDVDRSAMDRAATYLKLALSNRQLRQHAELSLRNSLLYSLLFQETPLSLIIERTNHLKIDLLQPHRLVLAMVGGNSVTTVDEELINRSMKSLQSVLDTRDFPLTTVNRTTFAAVVPESREVGVQAQNLNNLLKQTLSQFPAHTLISDTLRHPEHYRAEFHACQNLLLWAFQSAPHSVSWRHDYGLAAVLFNASNVETIRSFCLEALSPFAGADHRDLMTTLECYLDHECELSTTAKSLNIHYNTLRYRLDKIENILGEPLDNPRIRQKLRVAFLCNNTFGLI